MPQDIDEKVMVYLKTVVYVATPSNDLTTMLVRRMDALTGDMTARFKSIVVSAGTKN